MSVDRMEYLLKHSSRPLANEGNQQQDTQHRSTTQLHSRGLTWKMETQFKGLYPGVDHPSQTGGTDPCHHHETQGHPATVQSRQQTKPDDMNHGTRQ